jgi:hypothetical protein
MFPRCRIVVYDNQSTDSTASIAREMGCEVIEYNTGGKLSDDKYLEIKNNCWKGVDGWVIVADCDEFCDIDVMQLGVMDDQGATIVRFSGWNMVNLKDNMNFSAIKTGFRSDSYDKFYCFDARLIKEINYSHGCHTANPVGSVVFSVKTFNCRHYKYLNPDYMVKRHAIFAARLSDKNLQKGYGGHYLYGEAAIRKEFDEARKIAKKII